MSIPDLFMLGAFVLGGAAALLVVTARNVVHAALYLVIALVAVAASFLWMGAEFLAWAQVLVYVGAVVVLILFGLMLTRAPIGPMAQHNENRKFAVAVSGGLFVLLVTVIVATFGDATVDVTPVRVADLGEVLYVQWAFPFMVLGFLLTVSLIGALVLARREEGEGPLPDDTDEGSDQGLEDAAQEPGPSDVTSAPGAGDAGQQIGAP